MSDNAHTEQRSAKFGVILLLGVLAVIFSFLPAFAGKVPTRSLDAGPSAGAPAPIYGGSANSR